ncbi:fused signal recognition particle receptor [Lachnospiraceae bacterium XBB2008]|nr:fused signal recognition particle receptor [Lachnospiraceae bacterium XBB2008]
MYDSDYLKKLSEIDSIVEKPYISNEEVEPAEPEQTSDAEDKPRLFDKLKAGLSKTRKNIVYGIDTVFGAYDDLDDEFFEDLEEQLIIADVGVHTTEEVLDELRGMVRDERIHSTEDCRAALSRLVASKMSVPEDAYDFENGPSVVLVIGVNGVGKTTYCGKMASALKNKGRKVILAAADTFRAAATEQLLMWGERAGVDVISGQEGSDPASVIYDALHAAKARHADILICDTAGRLNNKKNLMNELDKIDRIISRELPEYKRENLIVLDATTGQNAMSQARDFSEVSDITGIVLTKMDGTAKGGIAIAIASELSVPVKFIGVGEGIDDCLRFDPEDFAKAMFEGASDEQI